ncbi:MAG: ABC transporter ATP-binding protein/permease [Defluviitaleaceae bacterium]|nr:ABC transporter ATP-binding protein/permease [Defluviitaleaceae bacterium]MCL2240856.1 ABC transporter ATP-binding protein/permease [Defluviitaleaceae bacterium]
MADKKRETRRTQQSGGLFARRGMPVEKAKDFKGSMRQLLTYLGAEKAVIILVSLVAVASTVLAVLGPRILGRGTDEIFAGLEAMFLGIGGIDFQRLGTILLIFGGIQVVNIVFNYIQGFIMAGVGARITYKLRFEISEKIHRLPLQYFDKNSHGDVLSRITNDVDTLSNTLSNGLGTMVMSITAVLGIIIMMLTISPLLTLVAMGILPLSGITVGIIVKKSQKYFKAQQENLGKLNGHIEEMFTSHAIVKSFNGEEASAAAFEVHNEKLYQAGWKANFLSGIMMPIIAFISNIGYVAVVVVGGTLAVSGRISIGDIQAFIQYTRQFGQPMAQLSGVAGMLQQTAAAAERVFAFLGEAEESPEPAQPVIRGQVKGHVAFDGVHFGYDPEVPVIKDFNAEVKPGQKIAIVGHTGAGKTTIVKLLMRFYDVDRGKITVDGTPITDYTRDGLRGHFGMVLQDTWLFNGSIADNIRYGKLDATDDDMKKAARAAQAHHFIRALPDGYKMLINEEADNISAGQKQLLTIARTILADPDILILDEATSNVDTRTEVLIQKAMDNLMRGRTSFVIAHRLSTIRSADLILVMREGDVVEQGSHTALLAQNGVYTALYNSQFDVVE